MLAKLWLSRRFPLVASEVSAIKVSAIKVMGSQLQFEWPDANSAAAITPLLLRGLFWSIQVTSSF